MYSSELQCYLDSIHALRPFQGCNGKIMHIGHFMLIMQNSYAHRMVMGTPKGRKRVQIPFSPEAQQRPLKGGAKESLRLRCHVPFGCYFSFGAFHPRRLRMHFSSLLGRKVLHLRRIWCFWICSHLTSGIGNFV